MGRVHILKSRAKPSYVSLEFDSYNAAIAYATKAAGLNPSKPYKRLKGDSVPVWCVTVRQPRNDRAEYVTFDSVPGYLAWPIAA